MSIFFDNSGKGYPAKALNPHFDPNKNHSEEQNFRQQMAELLDSQTLWGPHVYRAQNALGLCHVPYAIKKMQNLCMQESTFDLGEFKKIAKQYGMPQSKSFWSLAYNLFGPDRFTQSFFNIIKQATNLYEIKTWLEEQLCNVNRPKSPAYV